MLKKSLLIAGCTALAQVTVAVLYIVVARMSGPALLGNVVAAVAAGTFIAGFIDFGTNNLWIREVASGRAPLKELYTKIASKIFIALVLSLVIVVVALWLAPDTSFYATGILAFTTVAFQASLGPLKLSASGTRLSITMAMERIFAAVIFLALLLFNVPAHVNLVVSLATGSLTAGLLAYGLAPSPGAIFKHIRKPVWPWRNAASHGAGGAVLAAQTLDATILHAVAGPAATGIYGAVNRWTQPMGVFATAFATTGLPVVARTSSLRRAYSQLRHSWWMLGLGGVICLLVALGSPVLVSLLLGPEYQDSVAILAILAIATIPALINQPLYVFCQAMHLQKQVAFIVTGSVTLQLLLCAILGYIYAETGAAVSLAISQFLMLTCLIILIVRHETR
ncbi:oligosaccharide flippase family protein [Kocuria sp. CNJ-770]|uniref:oligosaccharide flippase family protein n=1 Tax=Kocuria sp. CNJ-770 TaxID=1904964 RepID=UPI00096A402D|nr:oligosaccharide flippase family protein [Kocuria sp. CNJ-770]